MYAAGMTLKEENYSLFKQAFEKEVADTIPPELLIPEISIDAEISLTDIDTKLTNALKSSKQISTPFQIGSIDWVGESLIAAAGKDLYQSVNGGTSWKKVATLPAPIGIVAQSSQLIAVVVGGAIYASTNKGKSFKKYVYKSGLKFQS